MERSLSSKGIIRVEKCKTTLCKQLSKKGYKSQEIEVMRRLKGSRNIIDLQRVEEDTEQYSLYMEYCKEGNLQIYYDIHLRNLPKQQVEVAIKPIITECLYAVRSCHDAKVVHGDLKLENFVFNHVPTNLRLIDFGASRILTTQEEKVQCLQWTVEYTAPESLRSELCLKSDTWAIGVMVYYMLQKRFPFVNNSHSSTYNVWKAILNDELVYSAKDWDGISEDCLDFVQGLLVKDVERRMSVYRCFKHSWLQTQ